MKFFISDKIKKLWQSVDWQLLLFLVLVLNVKLVVKLAAVLFIYIRRADFSFKFSIRQPGLSLFYPVMIIIALLDFVLFSMYKEPHYLLVLITGIGFWVMCILVQHQLILSVRKNSLPKIHNTVLLFFMINALVSFVNYFSIVIETGEINPYTYVGMYQKYFIGTGDYIRGVSFDTSTANAILNAFGVVYFLSRKQVVFSIVCMVVLLMTCSNFTNILLSACLSLVFVFRSDRTQKSIIVIHFVLLAVFMTNVSPNNNKYTISIVEKALEKNAITKKETAIPVMEKPDSLLSADERKYKFAKLYMDSVGSISDKKQITETAYKDSMVLKPARPKVNIYAAENQPKKDTSDSRLQLIKLSQQLRIDTLGLVQKMNPQKMQGKRTAVIQTFSFLKEHPRKVFTGNGVGNFSSKLAFRAAGVKTVAGYPEKYIYINKEFEKNHLAVYLDYFRKGAELHSVVNMPNAVYLQLIGEYGIAGLLAFFFFYLIYFAKGLKRLTYGVPVLFLLVGALWIDYWYEQLSVVIFFELLMFLNIRETTINEQADAD